MRCISSKSRDVKYSVLRSSISSISSSNGDVDVGELGMEASGFSICSAQSCMVVCGLGVDTLRRRFPSFSFGAKLGEDGWAGKLAFVDVEIWVGEGGDTEGS